MGLTDGRASERRAQYFNRTPPLQRIHTMLLRYSQDCGPPQTVVVSPAQAFDLSRNSDIRGLRPDGQLFSYQKDFPSNRWQVGTVRVLEMSISKTLFRPVVHLHPEWSDRKWAARSIGVSIPRMVWGYTLDLIIQITFRGGLRLHWMTVNLIDVFHKSWRN